MKNIYVKALIIAVVVGVAFGARWFRIDMAPASVNWDEAALGYNSYSMLKTGRDEFGKAMPVSLRSFDDYKPAGYAYLAVPAIFFAGLTETSTRFPSVVMGTLIVFFVIYIGSKISGKFSVGVAAGAITAFSPWALHFSRIAFESNVGTAWYMAGVAAFIYSLKNKNYYPVSVALFILSMYMYHAQRVIAPLTLIALTLVFWEQKKIYLKSKWLRLVIVAVMLGLPLGVSFLTEPAGSRLAATNIFKLWPFVPKDFPLLIFNPVYSLAWQLTGQFMAYFSPANLFFRGSTEPILRIPGLALFNVEILPFWLVGMLQVFRNKRLRKILLPILILGPLPGVVTWNWFSVIRTISLYPIFGIVAAVGLVWLLEKIAPKGIRFVATLAISGLCGLAFLFNFLTISLFAPYVTYGDFQPGFEFSVPYMLSEAKKYNKVIIDSPHIAPYIFVLFYGQYPPDQYLSEAGLNRNNSGTEEYSFGKFEFRKIGKDELYAKDILLMGSTGAIPDWRKEEMEKVGIKVADFPDPMGYTSFRVTSL